MEANIFFIESLTAETIRRHALDTLHLMCRQGRVQVLIANRSILIQDSDYAIFPNVSMVSEVQISDDFVGDIFFLNDELIHRLMLKNKYGLIGHLSLLSEPVMHLSPAERTICTQDIRLLRERMQLRGHTYYGEMIEYLTMVHVLNLYDIHARQSRETELPQRAAELMQQFISLLEKGHYKQEREISFYASELSITPHYLSEISRQITHQPASYWIMFYTINDIAHRLAETTEPLKEIAYNMNFSSEAYFTRYVQKFLGVSPSGYRKRQKTDSAADYNWSWTCNLGH